MAENNVSIEAIEKLATIIGESGASIVTEYTQWYIWASVSWMLFGTGLLLFVEKWEQPEDWDLPPIIIKFVIGFLGALIIAANLGDLLAPQGIAIHRLILDIRG